MIYSVWNQNARAYDYYQSMGATPISSATPSHLKRAELGIPPEKAAWPLPASAKLVGRGQYARGVVAGALGDIDTSPARPFLVLGAAALAFLYLFGRHAAR